MIFEEVATFEKLQALAGTDIEVLNQLLEERCKIVRVIMPPPDVNPNHHYDGIHVVDLHGHKDVWSSPRTFLLQP